MIVRRFFYVCDSRRNWASEPAAAKQAEDYNI